MSLFFPGGFENFVRKFLFVEVRFHEMRGFAFFDMKVYLVAGFTEVLCRAVEGGRGTWSPSARYRWRNGQRYEFVCFSLGIEV